MYSVGLQKNIRDSKNVESVPLLDALKRMENCPELKEQTEKIRSTETKEERDRLKQLLPAIIVSADTTSRKASPDDKRHGLIFIDLDGKDHKGIDIEKVVDSMHYPYLIGYFRSPSGNGLKVLCGIEKDTKTHRASFNALSDVFADHELTVDQSCKDLKRLTFLCHDPDIERTLIEPLKNWNGERIKPKELTTQEPVERNETTSNIEDAKQALRVIKEAYEELDYDKWLEILSGMYKSFGQEGYDAVKDIIGGDGYEGKPPNQLLEDYTVGTVFHYAQKPPKTYGSQDSLPPIRSFGYLIEQFPNKPVSVIDGVIGRGDKLILSASSKAGKTWLMLHLAYAVQNGERWLGHQCKKMDALYVNFELSEPWAAERVRLINRGMNFKEHPDALNLRGCDVTWQSLSTHIQNHIKTSKKDYGIIILDPIYKMLGDSDENANGDIARLLNSLERMGHTNGAAIAFSHHHSKGNKSNVDAIERMSGAGVWGRDPDAIIDMVSHEDDDCYVVEAITRNYAKPPKLVVRCEFPHFVVVDDANPNLLSKPGGSKKKLTLADVVAMCEQHSSGLTNPLLLQKLADKHNVSEETARTRVKEAVSTHRVDKDGKLIKPKKGYELNQNRIPNTVPDELGKAV